MDKKALSDDDDDDDDEYAAAYRRAHLRRSPYSPWERQQELSDLWPSDQEAFRELVRNIQVQK